MSLLVFSHPSRWRPLAASFSPLFLSKNLYLKGVVPTFECYEVCAPAWTDYVQRSLLPLITTGKGHPNREETLAFENQAEKASQPEKVRQRLIWS